MWSTSRESSIQPCENANAKREANGKMLFTVCMKEIREVWDPSSIYPICNHPSKLLSFSFMFSKTKNYVTQIHDWPTKGSDSMGCASLITMTNQRYWLMGLLGNRQHFILRGHWGCWYICSVPLQFFFVPLHPIRDEAACIWLQAILNLVSHSSLLLFFWEVLLSICWWTDAKSWILLVFCSNVLAFGCGYCVNSGIIWCLLSV